MVILGYPYVSRLLRALLLLIAAAQPTFAAPIIRPACEVLLRNDVEQPPETETGFIQTNRSIVLLEQVYPKDWIKLEELKGKSVLDAGTGGGAFTKDLRRNGVVAYGIDRKLHHSLEGIPYFLQADMRSTPFADQQFDYIYSSYSLFADMYEGSNTRLVNEALRELWRILKPNGILRLGGTSVIHIRKALNAASSGFKISRYAVSPDAAVELVRAQKVKHVSSKASIRKALKENFAKSDTNPIHHSFTIQDDGFDEYKKVFGNNFATKIEELSSGGHWIDLSAGEGMAQRDVYFKYPDLLHMTAVGLTSPRSHPGRGFQKYGPDKFYTFLEGTVEKLGAAELTNRYGKAELVTKVFEENESAEQIEKTFRIIGRVLKEDGEFIGRLPPSMYALKTWILDIHGFEPVSAEEFVKSSVLHLRRTSDTIWVPMLQRSSVAWSK